MSTPSSHLSTLARWAGLGLLLGLGVGCGPKGGPKYTLEGSLTQVMDLGFDTAFIDTTTDEIAVRLVRNKSGTEDVALKITYFQAGQELLTPSTLELSEPDPGNTARQRSVISRNVLDDTRRVFPQLRVGELSFLDKIKPDSTIRGLFHLTFVNGTEFASGRTVYGSFSAKVPP